MIFWKHDAMLRILARYGLQPSTVYQLLRYGTSGFAAVCADYGSFALLLSVVRAPLLVATVSSLLAGFIVSFIMNRLWVFRAHRSSAHKHVALQLTLYGLLFACNTAFTYLFIHYTSTWFGLSEYIGKFCCILLIMCWNFVLYKKLIFRINHDAPPTVM